MNGETRFGPYELVRRLGRGGMAETFVARRLGPSGFEQNVCVKRILPSLETDRSFVDQFQSEARVSASLRHANIVTVLDFGVVDGLPYLALELVDGIDLYGLLEKQRARGESLTSGLVAYVAAEVAGALEHAHGRKPQPIVHRDISPSNVLVSRAGEVKLSDFGIAKALRSTGGHTATQTIKGKVPYMAPEYAMSGTFDPRCDLFALGVMLYECLAGKRPYDGRTDLETLTRVQAGTHAHLSTVCPQAPKGLVDIVERLIDPDPEKRFPSATALLDALVEEAPPPTARKILGDLVKRETRGASEPSMPGAGPSQPPPARGPNDPAPASPNDPTRTRLPQQLVTDRTPVMAALEAAAATDPALTRTALAPDVLDELRSTIPSQPSPAISDPAALAAYQGYAPATRAHPGAGKGEPDTVRTPAASRTPWLAIAAGLVLLGGAAVAAAAAAWWWFQHFPHA